MYWETALAISVADAKVATEFPISPDEVVAAYKRTGLKPVRDLWLDRRNGCACAIGALHADNPELGCYDSPGAVVIAKLYGDKSDISFHFSIQLYLEEFAKLFDRTEIEHIEIDLARMVLDESEGWAILAWRNALAVRRAMRDAGLDPISFESYEEEETRE